MMTADYKRFMDTFSISAERIDAIDSIIKDMMIESEDLEKVIKEIPKHLRDENELKFAFFRLGQIETGEWFIAHIHEVANELGLDHLRRTILRPETEEGEGENGGKP